MKPEDHWQNVASTLRDNSRDTSDTKAPHGFATRVVALSELSPPRPVLVRLRNWSLLTAGVTALAFIALLTTQEPKTQFIPLPELDLPSPAAS